MDFSTKLRAARGQNVPKEYDNTFPTTKHTPSRRTPSFSSSSSLSSCSSSCFPDDSPPSPATPFRFSGVPFSWEHLPGIPKKPIHKKKDSTREVLPLPPQATPPTSKRLNFEEVLRPKKIAADSFRRDPFLAALLECSKNDQDDQESTVSFWNSPKVSRSISDRFGFISLYSSCKKTCAVSESILYLPRSSRASYDLIDRRSR